LSWYFQEDAMNEQNPELQEPARRPMTVFWASTLCAMIAIFQVVRLAPSAANPVVGWLLPVMTSALWLGYFRLRGRMTRVWDVTSGDARELAGFVQQGLDAFAALTFITLLSALSALR
jgi:hypothetical protein